MKKVLVIDNYDSFTYNLVHYIGNLSGIRPEVYRNDEISVEDAGSFDKILLSPGPGVPSGAGISLDLVKRYYSEKSILGICLGHQTIGEAFGATLVNLSDVYHGLATEIDVTDMDNRLFRELPASFLAGRYHSWAITGTNFPSCLKVTCMDRNNIIMAVSHREYDVHGIQFHPESVLTEHGEKIIANWLAF